MIARSGLAFSTRQCIFFVASGMEEDRKVAAHWQIATLDHRFGSFANHNPVAIALGKFKASLSEQHVADITADGKNLHFSTQNDYLREIGCFASSWLHTAEQFRKASIQFASQHCVGVHIGKNIFDILPCFKIGNRFDEGCRFH